MNTWGRVPVRLNIDKRFTGLDGDPQRMWLYLLTSVETTFLPGVIVADLPDLANNLRTSGKRWSEDRVLAALAPLEVLGVVRTDWDAGLLWLPDSWELGAPPAANIAKYWAIPWAAIPDCGLKAEIWKAFDEFATQAGKQHSAAFRFSCPDLGE